MSNAYSNAWFKVFLDSIDQEQTAREAAFVEHFLPLSAFPNVLDICCGSGRHCTLLSRHGYRATGLDRDAAALAKARRDSPSATFLQRDMREVPAGPFDGVLSLWQSFGYFDETANADLLARIAAILRPGGRFILDVYNRAFFSTHQGMRAFTKAGNHISESTELRGNRVFVELHYGSGAATDKFDWQLFEPAELCELGRCQGLAPLRACANFNVDSEPSAEVPRMQLIFERPTS